MWKITIISIISLQLIVWPISGSFIPVLLAKGYNMGMILCITTFLTVLVNTYIGLPLFYFLFGAWLRIPRLQPKEMSYLYSLVDGGFPYKWQRLLIIIIYYDYII